MGGLNAKEKPEELLEFRKQGNSQIEPQIPESPENRVRTDQIWIYILLGVIVILGPFAIYTLCHSDLRYYDADVDDCGNLCGYDNKKTLNLECNGQNKIEQKFTRITKYGSDEDEYHSTCVSACKRSDIRIFSTCIDTNFSPFMRSRRSLSLGSANKEIEQSISNLWKLIFTTLITIVISFGVMLLFRYFTALLVWGILILTVIILIAATVSVWAISGYGRALQVTVTVITIVVMLVLGILFKRISLIIILFKEAAKTVFQMPQMLLIPFLNSIIEIIVIAIFLMTSIYMGSAGSLKEVYPNVWRIESNFIMVFTIVFNIFVGFWLVNFICGLQYMTISGSVSAWFFSRNKESLQSPVRNSFLTTFRFHIGSIALGSLIITIVAVIKCVIRYLTRNSKFKLCFVCCIDSIDAILQYLSKNAYIVQAIHGRPFFKSGKRAVSLLFKNAASVLALNSVGSFILFIVQAFIVILSTGLGGLLFSNLGNPVYNIIAAAILNCFVVFIIFNVFETTIDTLFICFCEDKEINDGISKPFYTSKSLMLFVDKSNKIYNANK